MITTDPNPTVSPYHDRMPAVLEPGEIDDFLAGRMRRFRPRPQSLLVADAANPLRKPPDLVQGELF
jgi:putative SOS response-associated peptidase YedK